MFKGIAKCKLEMILSAFASFLKNAIIVYKDYFFDSDLNQKRKLLK